MGLATFKDKEIKHSPWKLIKPDYKKGEEKNPKK